MRRLQSLSVWSRVGFAVVTTAFVAVVAVRAAGIPADRNNPSLKT